MKNNSKFLKNHFENATSLTLAAAPTRAGGEGLSAQINAPL